MPIDPASYRDPAGHVYQVEDKIYRTILPAGLPDYEFVRDTDDMARLVERGMVIASTEVDPNVLGLDAPAHGRTGTISMPTSISEPTGLHHAPAAITRVMA